MKALVIVGLVVATTTAASVAAQRWPSERPPKPLAAKEVSFPPYEVRTLPNGLQVVVVLHHEQPSVSMRLLVRAGGAQDPRGKAGVASLLASVLDQGTKTRTAKQIAEMIDTIGGGLGTGAGSDLSFVNAVSLKDSFERVMDLFAEVARHPAIAGEEVERQRQQVLSGLRVSNEDPDYVAGIVVDRLIYGFHPYGMPSSGTPDSIARITRDDLVAFHKTWFAPNNAVLAIVGDVTAAEAFASAQRVFGDWGRQDVPAIELPAPPEPTRRLIVIDRPGAVQTELRVGHLAIPRKHPDFLALNIATKILGGEGANRLHRVLRTERGLTYGASADLETFKLSGGIVAETDTRSDATADALRLTVEEFWNLQRERVGERELTEAKAYLTGNFPLTIETPDAIALQVLNAVFYGLDLKEVETYRERVNAISVDEIQRVARAYLKPDRLSVVLVGDASSFVDKLKGVGFDKVERISLPELDLTAADLKRSAVGGASRDDAAAAAAGAAAPTPAPRAPMSAEGAAEAARAHAIISRAIESQGGLDRLRAIKTMKATGKSTVSTMSGPISAETVTYVEYPDRVSVTIRMIEGEMVQTYAAGTAWINDRRGDDRRGEARLAPPPVRDQFRDGVRREMIPLLLAAAAGHWDVRILPEERKDGVVLQPVEMRGQDFGPVVIFLDNQGLVVRQTYPAPPPDTNVTYEERFSDFRSIDGIRLPFKAVVRRAGVVVIERDVQEIKLNTPIDPALFRRPS